MRRPGIQQFLLHPSLDGRPDHDAPEVAVAIAGIRQPEMLPALADSLAWSVERALSRHDFGSAHRRLFGLPIDHERWEFPAWRAALDALLGPEAPGAGDKLPPLPARPRLGATIDGRLDRWLRRLVARNARHPLEHRVYFPTSAGTLIAGAWDPNRTDRGIAGYDGGFEVLTPGVSVVHDSWELAAGIAAALRLQNLSDGPTVIASGGLLLDAKAGEHVVQSVDYLTVKAEAIATWRRWHAADFTVVLPSQNERELALDGVAFVGTLRAAMELLQRGTRYGAVRPRAAQTASGRRLLNDMSKEHLARKPPLPVTRLRDRGFDLEDWVCRGQQVRGEQIVFATGPGGVGKSRAALQLYASHDHVGLLDMSECPPDSIREWVASELGGERAFAILKETPGAVVIVDGIDEGPDERVAVQLQEVNRHLGRLRRVYIGQTSEVLETRVGARNSPPVFQAELVASAEDLRAERVDERFIPWLVDAEGRVKSMALAAIELRALGADHSSEDRPETVMLRRVTVVERDHNPQRSYRGHLLEEMAAKQLDTGCGFAAPPEICRSPFLHQHEGRYAFRHATYAELFGALWLLQRGEPSPASYGRPWRKALEYAAEELALNPFRYEKWPQDSQAFLFAWMGLLAVDEEDEPGRCDRWVALARDRSEVVHPALDAIEGAALWKSGDRRGIPLLRRAADGPDDDWAADARLRLGCALTELGAPGAATARLGAALEPLGADLAEVMENAFKRPFEQGRFLHYRVPMLALAGMSDALCWLGAFEAARRLLKVHGHVCQAFGEDGIRAVVREAHVLITMCRRDDAHALRDDALASLPPGVHRVERAALDLRLGYRVGNVPDDPAVRARLAWARWDGFREEGAQAIRLCDLAGRRFDACRVLWEMGRYGEALARISSRVAEIESLPEANDLGALATWAPGTDPRLATLAGRLAVLREREGDPSAAGLLPPW